MTTSPRPLSSPVPEQALGWWLRLLRFFRLYRKPHLAIARLEEAGRAPGLRTLKRPRLDARGLQKLLADAYEADPEPRPEAPRRRSA